MHVKLRKMLQQSCWQILGPQLHHALRRPSSAKKRNSKKDFVLGLVPLKFVMLERGVVDRVQNHDGVVSGSDSAIPRDRSLKTADIRDAEMRGTRLREGGYAGR